MKQHLGVASAFVLLLVIWLLWAGGRDPSGPVAAALIGSASATDVIAKQAPIQCSDWEREPHSEQIGPRGGILKTDYAAVLIPHGAYGSDTRVTMIPDSRVHGITLEPTPGLPVILIMKTDECGDDSDTTNYSMQYLIGGSEQVMPAARFTWRDKWYRETDWAVMFVDPRAFDEQAMQADSSANPLIRGGFVVLSN